MTCFYNLFNVTIFTPISLKLVGTRQLVPGVACQNNSSIEIDEAMKCALQELVDAFQSCERAACQAAGLANLKQAHDSMVAAADQAQQDVSVCRARLSETLAQSTHVLGLPSRESVRAQFYLERAEKKQRDANEQVGRSLAQLEEGHSFRRAMREDLLGEINSWKNELRY